MTIDYKVADEFIEKNLDDSIEEVKKIVAQPSISAKKLGLRECADMVVAMLEKRGFDVTLNETDGAPIVTAERKGHADRTLLFYNHYDVQPPEPLELWDSPAFEPEIRDGKLYGRGTSDDKGDLVNRLLVLDAILAQQDDLPCNIKFLVEGEEEVSSKNLELFVYSHKDELASDVCIWEGGGVDHHGVPVQYLGLRGICYVELEVETANQDIHSGLGGSIFPNAAWRLVWALNSLKDEHENILIEGFYDDVLSLSEEEKAYFKALPDFSADYQKRYGIKRFLKDIEGGYAMNLEENTRPTCTICGLTSGYQGKGSKTVMPAKATAKIDFRLVPNQTPEKVLELLRAHLDRNGFEDIKIVSLGGGLPSKTDIGHPFVRLVVDSAKDVYDAPMQITPITGGSGPNFIVEDALKVPIVSLGIGYMGAGAHSPNENIRIEDYLKSAKHLVRVLGEYGEL